MTHPFPPHADDQAGIAIALNAFGSAVPGRTAHYVSAPISTGQRFVRWLKDEGARLERGSTAYTVQHLRRVVEPNLQAAGPVVRSLRRTTGQITIDPTAFGDVAGWTQGDYRVFWAAVIERFAETVTFLDGWEYSEGCCYEWLRAVQTGARTRKSDGGVLESAEAIEMMGWAVKEIRALGGDGDFIEAVCSAAPIGGVIR
jgi:hypothetical protein